MDNKLTMLLYQTPESVRTVPEGAFVVSYAPLTNQLDEYRFPAPLPEPAPGRTLFTVPTKIVEPAFAVHDAISCTRLNPGQPAFNPSFCFSFRMRYISPSGLKKLLFESSPGHSRLPDCIDLEKFYLLMQPHIRAAAQKAAASFSGGRLLPYAYWWQDLINGTKFRNALEAELRLLFNAYGFRLETGSLRIMGLASLPVS